MSVVFEKTKLLTDKQFHYCPGCNHGIIHRLVAEVIDEMNLDGKVIGVAPVGCSVFAYDYFNCDMYEAAHGRAPAVATGAKRVVGKDTLVFTYQGDGDLASIGTAEIVHAAHRGEKISTIFVNNAIYGMTGGQYSPMTPYHSKATTAPYGMIEPDFNLAELAKAAGATFVARCTTFHAQMLSDLIVKGIQHKGFSLIEAVSACPISFGRQNKMGGPAEMMMWQRDHAVPVAAWDKLPEEKREGKFPIGVLYQVEGRKEYTEAYDELIAVAQGGK